MLQLPPPVMVTVEPRTVHWPAAPKLTGSPELEVALTAKGGAPKV
jgi:hypothetical protein